MKPCKCNECGMDRAEVLRSAELMGEESQVPPVEPEDVSQDPGGTTEQERVPPPEKKRGPGRPKDPSKENEVVLHAHVPDWLKQAIDDIADRDVRDVKVVVARVLKLGLGLELDAKAPPHGWTPPKDL